MPLNRSNINEINEYMSTLDYQSRVNIYDQKCNGCGFASIMLYNNSKNNKVYVTNRLEEAIHLARAYDLIIKRGCCYPNDGDKFITLNEIVTNGCDFWNESKVISYSLEETEFIEVENVEDLDVERKLSII